MPTPSAQRRWRAASDGVELQTPRLTLDALRSGDADALFAYRGDPVVSRYQGWQPVSRDEAADWIAALAAEPVPGRWWQRAIRLRESGELIGDLGLSLPEDEKGSVEFGVTLAPAHQGRGYAGEAVRTALGWAFARGANRATASVDPRNTACVALLCSLGMRQEAHFRESYWLRSEWADDLVFALLAREWDPGARTG
ncbi:GNAT family protein [Dyella sp. BiH032]|uniref:GNAT family N-acetyltransferase n=1 Tax=Dyella sp. BiH032 TaxID=3075430 RepID=UPI00289356A1|nr:GNAT family protein [Dyella sp. BiH032]WNL47677.1 GNAT family protein [Dyella sp. BiH032]